MTKQKDPSKIGAGQMLAWQSRAISASINVITIGYLLVYCTNALGMSAALVGTILMACKLVDGVTNLVAGYIVDNTNTKWGRGRPYEWCIVALWLTTWLLFSVPAAATTSIKCVWIVVCYTLAVSVFTTFLNANGTVYMVRAFHNEQVYVKLSSVGGVLVTACVIVFNTILPSFQAKVLNSASGWSKMIAFIAVPMAVLGIMRFFFIKENDQVSVAASQRVTLRDVGTLLKTNKFIYILMMVLLVSMCISNMGVATYYFIYVVGNLGIAGVMSLLAIVVMPTMFLYPKFLKKMTIVQLIQRFMALYFISAVLSWFAKDNLLFLGIAGIFAGAAALPMSYLNGLLIVDLADYNEWIGHHRMEGTLNSVVGFAQQIGAAFGTFLLGAMLSTSGFNGMAKTQPDSAILMIRFLYCIVPAIGAALMILIFRFWKLDKVKPQMQAELSERRAVVAAKAESAAVAVAQTTTQMAEEQDAAESKK